MRRLAGAAEFIRRRAAGEYEVDPESGFDPELNQRRADACGDGRCTGAGSASRCAGLSTCRRQARLSWWPTTRAWFRSMPSCFRSACSTSTRPRGNLRLLERRPGVLGAVARPGRREPAGTCRRIRHEAERLLHAGELVGVFPEGFKGIGKPFSDRYHLQRFGRGGFARTALRTGVAADPCRDRRRRRDLPDGRGLVRACRQAEAAVLPDHAAVPVVRPARRGPAAVEVADRVLRSGADRTASPPISARTPRSSPNWRTR